MNVSIPFAKYFVEIDLLFWYNNLNKSEAGGIMMLAF